jgi:tetratricopeptide (TPR) repeat protein
VRSGLSAPTDFDRELRQMDAAIEALGPVPSAGRIDADTAAALASRLYQRGSLTGREGDFTDAEDVVARAGAPGDPPGDLSLIKAAIDFRFHRFAATRSTLERAPALADSADAQAMFADLDVQDGSYDTATAGYEAIIRREARWDVLARLAYLTGRRGHVDAADQLYVEAEDEISAKQMRAYAWIEVQRGFLQFSRGRYDEALGHYRQARRAYSGYWLVDEYTAELLGAERKFDEAIALYEKAIARAPRPDLLQQLGDLYLFAGRPLEAARWHDRALEGYLRSARRGEVQFLHHLAAFYADLRPDGAEAVKWARQDFELRPGTATEDMLAWALYRHGQIPQALAAIDHALAAGVVDAHLFYHAATVTRAAGRAAAAQRHLARLAEINPRYGDFHVHR